MPQKDDLLQWEGGRCKPERDMVISENLLKFWIHITPFLVAVQAVVVIPVSSYVFRNFPCWGTVPLLSNSLKRVSLRNVNTQRAFRAHFVSACRSETAAWLHCPKPLV